MSVCCSATPSEWLATAARRLGTADPGAALGAELCGWLPASFDAVPNALVPGGAPLELSFSELEPAALRFDLEPPTGIDVVVDALARRAEECFGTAAADALSTRAAALSPPPAGARFAAFAGAAIDRDGLAELTLYRPVGACAGAAAATAREQLPGLEPLMHAVSVSAGGVAERAYLVARAALEPWELGALLAPLGLAERAPELVTTVLRLLGGAPPPLLPGGTVVVGLREQGGAVEVKLELMVGGLGVARPLERVAALLAERPAARAAHARWLAAIAGPGMRPAANIVSVRVAAAYGARLSVYVHADAARGEERRDGQSHAVGVG